MLPRIVVVGVGGGGGSSVQRLVDEGLEGVECAVVDADGAALAESTVPARLRIGDRLTRGLGAGGDLSRGALAAEEGRAEVLRLFRHADMVVVTAGLAGGTAGGAAPLIAGWAREMGALTVGVATWPFTFEGRRRWNVARASLQPMQQNVDTLILIEGDRLLAMRDAPDTVVGALRAADEVAARAIRGMTDLIVVPGPIHFDFADARAVLAGGGGACVALGRGEDAGGARRAAEEAIACPLLAAPLSRARGILLNVTGGPEMTLHDVSEAVEVVHAGASRDDAGFPFGALFDPALGGTVRVTIVATGIDATPPG